MIKILEIKSHRTYCPSQWDLIDMENNEYYVRYRFGIISVLMNHDKYIFRKVVGDIFDGSMTTHEMKNKLDHIFDFSEAKTCTKN